MQNFDDMGEIAYIQSKKNGAQINDITNQGQIKGFVVLTQAEYDAITVPDSEIVYLIRG